MPRLIPLIAVAALAACSSPNVRSASSYDAPKAPPVRQPVYNPYAPYGEANATWTPPTFNRDGTIVKPAEPSTQDDRPSYETAPWANGASGGSQLAPPGTF
ncbi:MAG: hypothetical protein J0H14_01325 [Alphaproteobacteria bacterium]|nr:hypothetical protein [Alphaproteobacteria bacterium]